MTATSSAFSDIAPDPLLLSAMAAMAESGFRKGWIDPAKQSVAVLPFLNMSGDVEQEYFADGITEDIITELARFSNLFVVSRNSSFHFKGRTGLVQDIGAEIGAKYVVEGSVRKAGNRVRVTAQLVEAAAGGHVWAERFDGDLSDIFAVQDELVRAIAGSIPGAVERQTLETVRRKPPENLNAYECELRGRWAFGHWTEGVDEAVKWFEQAVESDPNYAPALAWLGRCYKYRTLVSGVNIEDVKSTAQSLIDRAVALDARNPTVHACAAGVYIGLGQSQLARRHADRACELNPHDPAALVTKALVLTYGGELEEALVWHAKSEKIEPYAADDQRLDILCDTYYLLGQYEKVIQIHQAYRNAPAGIMDILAAALAQAGRVDEASRALEEMEVKGYSREDSIRSISVQLLHCSRAKDREHWLDGYRKAGLEV